MKKVFFFLFLSTFIMWNSINAQNTRSLGDTVAFWEIIDFDSTSGFIHVDTSSQNIWQIGHPQKIIFNSAYSTQKAIVTDTINNYPPNNHSYFDLYVGSFNHPGYPIDIFIDFWHKFDTDTLKDGGYISVSWDKGATWMNVINDTIYNGISPHWNWYFSLLKLYSNTDVLFNGESGFSGNSKKWIHTTHPWHRLVVKDQFPPDTMIIRFNFISDSIDNPKEGWMIDHIRLYSIELGDGINEINSNIVSISPNPFTTSTQITLDKTHHNISLAVYDIQGKLIMQNQYVDCNQIQLNRDGLGNGMYFLKLTLDEKWVETGKIVVSD